MPVIKAAKKAMRSSARKRVFNDRRRRAMKANLKDTKAVRHMLAFAIVAPAKAAARWGTDFAGRSPVPQRLKNGERREWIKPIMFSGGFGQIDHTNLEKTEGDVGMLVVQIGGPAYRIGMGGGAASSKAGGEDEANADLDFNAVQRGDAEMSNKLNRVVKACVELEGKNPILSIHDQGAGGNCNVCKELIYPKGGELNIREVKLGDATLSVLEIWGAEYQENSAMLIAPESLPVVEKICARERCPFSVLGSIDGSGRVKLVDPTAQPG